jgi:hypothetical protein
METGSVSANAGWIESRRYDLGLLALPPLLGLLICTFAGSVDAYVISGASLFLLGMPHYLSTYGFYLDDKNLAYARTRKLAFFVGPVVVIGFLTASLALHLYLLVALWVDAWNVFHVSRQSVGILGIYRHLNGGDNRVEKLPANVALVALAAGMYSVTIVKQPSFMYYLKFLPFAVAPYLGPVLLTIGGIALAILLTRMLRRGARLFSPEMIFLVGSIVLFSPYLLISSRSTASSAMLTGHYVQYLGILWLLNHRKYDGQTGSAGQRALGWISSSVPRIVILLLSIVAATSLVDRYVHHISAMGFHTWILNLIVLMHFYLDGVFWAFKHRHTRDSIGPYLLLPDHRATAAAPAALPLPSPAV